MPVFGALENELTLDKSSFSRGINEAEAEMQGLDSAADNAGSKMSAMGDKMKSAGMAATVGLTAPLAAAGYKSLQAASDVEEMQSKMQTVFGNSTSDIRSWAAAQEEATGQSELAFQEYATQLGDTFKPMGFAQDEATSLSKDVSSLAVDLASFNNMSTTESLERLQGGLIGNHENLQAFGVMINQTTLDKKLQEMFGKGADAATEQEKALARLQLVQEGTTDAQGDAARTAGSFANQMRALQGSVREAAVEIGNVMMPVMKPLVATVKSAVDRFANLSKPVKTAIVAFGALAAALGPVLLGIGVLLTLPITGTMAAAGAAVVGLTAVVAGLASAFGGPLLSTINSVLTSLRGTFGPILSQITSAWASMDGRVQSVASSMQEAILTRLLGTVQTAGAQIQQWLSRISQWWTAHGQGVVTTINQFSTHAQEAVIQMMAAISSAFQGTGESEASFGYFFVESLNEMLAAVQVIAPQLPQPLTQAFSTIRQTFSTSFAQIRQAVASGLAGVKALLRGDVGFAKQYFALALSQAKTAVTSGWSGVQSLFAAQTTKLKAKAATIPSQVASQFAKLKTQLPKPVKQALSTAAKEYDTHRQNVIQKVGLLQGQLGPKYQTAVNGIKQKAQSALSKATGFWNTHKGAVTKAVNQIKGPVQQLGQRLGFLDKRNKLTEDGMIALGSSLLTLAGPVGIATGLAAKLGLAWKKNLFSIQTTTNQAFAQVTAVFNRVKAAWPAIVQVIGNEINNIWMATGRGWVNTVTRWMGLVKGLISGILRAIIPIVSNTLGNLTSFWEAHGNDVMFVLGALLVGVSETIRLLVNTIMNIVEPALKWIGILWKNFGDELVAVLDFVSELILGTIGWMFDALATAIRVGMAVIDGDWSKAWDLLASYYERTLDGIISFLDKWVGGFLDSISGFVDSVVQYFKDMYDMLIGGSIIPDMLADILSAVTSWDLAGTFRKVLDGALKAASGFASKFVKAGKGLIDGFVSGIKDKVGAVGKAVGKATKGARKYLPGSDAELGALRDLTYAGEMLPETLASGMLANTRPLSRAADNIARAASPAVGPNVRLPANTSPAAAGARSEGDRPIVIQLDAETTKAVLEGKAAKAADDRIKTIERRSNLATRS